MKTKLKNNKGNAQLIFVIVLSVLLVAAVVALIILISKKNGDPKLPVTTSPQAVTTETTGSQPLETTSQAPTTEISTTEPGTTETTSAKAETSQPSQPSQPPQSQMPAGGWDLTAINNDVVPFGYSDANRDANMIPTDWKFYESKWGMYNVNWIGDISRKVIYLTMDCGFANPVTEGILDILDQKGVKATFFITKMFYDESKPTIKRMIESGHLLGNHTCTHPNMPKAGIEAEKNEILTLNNLVKQDFGYDMKLFRFPEGAYSAQSLALVDNLGMKSVFWSYAYNDYSNTQPPVEPSYQRAVQYLHPGAIFLLHASSSTNAQFLARWIDAAKAQGYTFELVPLTAN